MTAAAFWKNGSFAERVLKEISGTCAAPHMLLFPLPSGSSYIVICVYLFPNQKLTKSMSEYARYGGIYMREKYPCKNLGVKEGGGHLLEGGVFSSISKQLSPPFTDKM